MASRSYRLIPETQVRSTTWYNYSQWLSQFRRGDFQRISQLIATYFPRSAAKRQQRNVPFVQWFSRELAPHYRHPPEREFLGPPAVAQQLARAYQTMGLDAVLREASHRLVTQHTVAILLLPMPGADMRWQPVILDPWEMEVDPHPVASQSVTSALAIRCRVPRSCTHGEIRFDVLEMQRAVDAREAAALGVEPQPASCYYQSDRLPVFGPPGTGALPLGRYPMAVGRLGDSVPGDFFGPLPEWLYQAQVGLSLAHSDNEFRNRYSAGQLIGYGLQQEAAREMDWGTDTIAATEQRREDTEIVNLERPYDAGAFARSIAVFREALEQASGLPPSELGGAVTAEALQLKLWQRFEQRADVTEALQAMERSLVAALRYCLGWNFGAGSEPLAPATVRVTYRMPQPPHNPLHTAQANRMEFEDGTSTPGQKLMERRPFMSAAQAAAEARANAEAYARIRAAVAGALDVGDSDDDAMPGTTPPADV
jgi:hypothetical protein